MNRYSLAIFAAAVVMLIIAAFAPPDTAASLAASLDAVEYRK